MADEGEERIEEDRLMEADFCQGIVLAMAAIAPL